MLEPPGGEEGALEALRRGVSAQLAVEAVVVAVRGVGDHASLRHREVREVPAVEIAPTRVSFRVAGASRAA